MNNSSNPITPWELLSWISGLPERNAVCVDCGAGTTGTANFLATAFDRSIALDINPILRGSAPKVRKMIGSANRLPFKTGSVDLLLSIQALHHFDRDKHVKSALRVLRPGGVFAAICWGEIEIPTQVRLAYAPIFEAIAPYWETSRADTLAGYPNLFVPGLAMTFPTTYQSRRVNLDQFEEIVATWSGIQAALRAGVDIPEPEGGALDTLDRVFEMRWPLIGKVFRV